jgi:hypothetical protein
LYGYGDLPADIAIVAQAPGGDKVSDRDGNLIADGRRTWKNYTDANHSDAAIASRNGFSRDKLETLGNYSDDIKPLVDALERVWQRQLNRSCRIYYTQHTKCDDIHTDSFDPETDDGQDLCSNYLVPELKLIQPDLVLVMGGKPDKHLQRAMSDLGVKPELPANVKDIIFSDPDSGSGVQTYPSSLLDADVLPSYHYGYYGMLSMRRYTLFDDDNDYWETLAEKAVDKFM